MAAGIAYFPDSNYASPAMFRRWFLLTLILLSGLSAKAHQVSMVQMEFVPGAGEWLLFGEMDIAYMLPETRKVPGAPPLSRAAAMKFPAEEFARIRRETETTLRQLLRITFAGKDVPWGISFPDFEVQPLVLPEDASDIALLSTRISIPPVPGEGELRIHWAGDEEAELVILEEKAGAAEVTSALPGGSLVLLKKSPTGESMDREKPATGGWVQMGYHHVLPEGRDHILFILGIFLLVPKWRPLLGQSLLFTLAHSVTLALSVFGWVQLPSRPVEILIAVSIAWIGIENLFLRGLGKRRLALVFAFGLLHGLGFASAIGGKMDGIPRTRLAGPLVGFNVGVELAQITILAAAFLILWPLRKWMPQVQRAGSLIIALAGLTWAIQRLFFPASPIF